jgi:hippurate hydrolase
MTLTAPDDPRSEADFIALRHYLHSQPELGYEEDETAALVARYLRQWDFEVETGLAGTGVIGTLVSGDGTGSVALRADMDALPIAETTNLPYASRRHGLMHACGHDGHTTILLAAARQLAETKAFSGTVRLIFQPAEETGGGARRMVEEGLFDRFSADAVFGLHNWPGMPVGQFGFLEGPAMASVEMAVITIRGRGGHGAKPHLAVDPVVVASSLVMALQTVVSRNVDPLQVAVLTVGSIHGGTLPNIIPDSVKLELTVRAFDEGVRQSIRSRVTALVHAHAAAFGAEADLYYPPGFPETVNDPSQTRLAAATARRHFGAGSIDDSLRPITASEDFSYMLQQRPGSFLFLGNGDSADLHSPAYDFNDALIATGARYWRRLVEDLLPPAGR